MARWGGEEFVLILPGLRKREGKALADQARADLEGTVFDEAGRITASFGVAECVAGDTLDSVMARADAALYAAKRQGRNGVRVAMDDGRLTRMDLPAFEGVAATPAPGKNAAMIVSDPMQPVSDHTRLVSDHARLVSDHARLVSDEERYEAELDEVLAQSEAVLAGKVPPTF